MNQYGNVKWAGAVEEKKVMRKRDHLFLWLLLVLGLLMLAGCRTETTYYPNGQIQSHSDGAIDWSNGKTLSFSVIGK